MQDFLLVIDMQNDFISGALGTPEANAIVPRVKEKIEAARASGVRVVFTRDTHTEDYLNTQEGRNLPVPHCLLGTGGWQICGQLDVADAAVFDKPGFGSPELIRFLCMLPALEEVEFVGLCTDICVISNAMLVKASLPNVPIYINADLCAGVTPESHQTALDAMAACQMAIVHG